MTNERRARPGRIRRRYDIVGCTLAVASATLLALAGCGPAGGTGSASQTSTHVALGPCDRSSVSAGSAATPAPPTGTDDLAGLSDEFGDAATLGSWTNLAAVEGWPSQIETIDVNKTSPGSLYLVPYTSTWFEEYHGVFLFKSVSGDFMATARIKANGKQTPVPTSPYSLAGVMARAPRDVTPQTWTAGHENWVFITTGIGDIGQARPQIETKTTVNSHSVLVLKPSRTDWVDLRVVRVGRVFAMLYRFGGEAWTLSECYDRPDMPQTLQVGLNAYTDWGIIDARFNGHEGDFNRTLLTGPETHPDLIAQSDYFHYQRPPIDAALRAQIAAGKVPLDAWLPDVMQ